jgi:hypothetical protein
MFQACLPVILSIIIIIIKQRFVHWNTGLDRKFCSLEGISTEYLGHTFTMDLHPRDFK